MWGVNDERLTVDELARRAGTVSSTVRLYQSRGLLPPPARSGRMAFYGPGHLARMRLIGQLQERGFSLAAIKDLVDSWEAGRDLADVLGLEQRAATWAAEEPARLGLRELRRRLPRGTLSPAVLRRAIGLGLLQPEGRGFHVASPKLLETGAELVRLGVPIDAVLDEYEQLTQTTADIAARFTELFERHLWQPFAEAGMPPEQIGQLTATLERLGPLAESIVALTLRHALQQQAAAFIAKQAATTIRPQDSPR
jgi:DNA-binding transcriptional MerR regulator